MQAVLAADTRQEFVVRRGGLQLPGAVEVTDGNHAAVGQLPDARDALVQGMVGFEVLALEFFVALTPQVEPCGTDPDVVLGPLAHEQRVALAPAGLVDQAGSGRPAGIVERRFVQRCQDAIKGVLLAHAVIVSLAAWQASADVRWSKPGAHLELQTRARALDGALRQKFEQWYPGLRDGELAAGRALLECPLLAPPSTRAGAYAPAVRCHEALVFCRRPDCRLCWCPVRQLRHYLMRQGKRGRPTAMATGSPRPPGRLPQCPPAAPCRRRER